MSIIDFVSRFPDETSCKQKFKEYREEVGVVCSKCGGKAEQSCISQNFLSDIGL